MRPLFAALLASLLSFAIASSAAAQAGPTDPAAFLPRYTVGLGFNNIRANAPPSSCGCFDMNGGFLSGSAAVNYWLSAAAEVTGGHATNIGPLGQSLTLTTYTVGPRVDFRLQRFSPYVQVLLGAAHASDSYFPENGTYSTSANSFAFSTGGGVEYFINHRFTIRVIEAQYLHTSFPNGGNDSQNHLMLGAGVVFKLRGHYAQPDSARARR